MSKTDELDPHIDGVVPIPRTKDEMAFLSKKKSSTLQRMNQERWNKTGQLLRTAGILETMARQYPNIKDDLRISIEALKDEANLLDVTYYAARQTLRLKDSSK